jgi:nucleoside-diphosphate-sugar epimerase
MTEAKHVFITGADSAAGQAVAQRLIAAGHSIAGVVADSAGASALRQSGGLPVYPDLTRAGEISSALKATGAKVIIHLAGQAANHVPQIPAKWESVETLLTAGTAALLEAAATAGVEYIIFASYAFVYSGDHLNDEDAPTGGDSAVIRAALSAEQAVLTSSIPAAVLRVGCWYGVRSPETVELRNQVKAGRPVFDSSAHTSWIHLDDLSAAVLQVLEAQPHNTILNIVDDKPAAIADVTASLASAMHVTVSKLPAFLQSMRMGKQQAGLLQHSTQASNTRAKALLGWQPHYPGYREGLEQVMLVLRAEEPVY